MVADRLGVAVLGAGAWGINHVRALTEERRAELRLVVDPDPAVAARVAAVAPGVAVVADVDRVLDDPTIAAVVIATPAVTHAALAQRALAAGKHVLVEKPMAMTAADAHAVAAAADRAGRVLLVGHLMLYHPAVVQLRARIHAGELGPLHYLQGTRVNLGRLRTDENALWSLGPHDVAMLDYIVGAAPERVTADGAAYLQPGVEDVVFVTLHYPGGVMAQLHLSWLNPRKERRLVVVGAHKMAEFDDVAADKLRVFDRGYDRPPDFTAWGQYLTLRHGDVHTPAVEMAEPLRVMLAHFVACCAGEATPRTDAASGVRVVEALAAADASLAASRSR